MLPKFHTVKSFHAVLMILLQIDFKTPTQLLSY